MEGQIWKYVNIYMYIFGSVRFGRFLISETENHTEPIYFFGKNQKKPKFSVLAQFLVFVGLVLR